MYTLYMSPSLFRVVSLVIIFTPTIFFFFFFNDTATTEIYTLSLHDALPISRRRCRAGEDMSQRSEGKRQEQKERSEEHTSELQSPCNLVCRLLLEKKKKKNRQQEVEVNKLQNNSSRTNCNLNDIEARVYR